VICGAIYNIEENETEKREAIRGIKELKNLTSDQFKI
jgi:hypothetical protein